MSQVLRLVQVHAGGLPGQDEYALRHALGGYVLELPSPPVSPEAIRAWGCVVLMADGLDRPEAGGAPAPMPSLASLSPARLRLRAVGRLVPVVAPPSVRPLRPVRSGQAYLIVSPPERRLVTPELAEALEPVFQRFAHQEGFSPQKPLAIALARGFQPGSAGHGEGRAADIAAVDGKSLLEWKREWDRAMAAAEKLPDAQQCAEAIAAERKRNRAYGLYKALQEYGGWRVNPKGWRVYRGVMQLFGPWTATEGPWAAMQITDPNPYQRQRLADQHWVFEAHQDHIHVAK